MARIRIGTRASIEGRLVGASNLDITSYQDATGATTVGPTVMLSSPDAPPTIVGTGSVVRIGSRDYRVDEITVGRSAADSAVELSPLPTAG